MSRSVTALGQHTLPIRDHKALVAELSKRFEANVYLGFNDPCNHVKDSLVSFKSRGLTNPEEGNIRGELYLLEEAHFSPDANSFILIIEDYYYKWLFETFGEAAGSQKEFIAFWGDNIKQNNESIQFFLEGSLCIDFYFSGIGGYLTLESGDVGFDEYFLDWTTFFGLLTRTEHDYSIELYKKLLEYRNTNRNTILKLGGNCIYYHDDQGMNTGKAVQGNEWDMTWETIEKEFNHPKVKQFQINLCDALTNPTYLKQIQELTKYSDHEYSVFYDDFRELTWDDIIKPTTAKEDNCWF